MREDGWAAAITTVAVILLYELWLAFARRNRAAQLARATHASLRADWFDAVSADAGSEILAVQTLRNSLMSASMTASTAVLGLMGSITLAAPSLRSGLAAPDFGLASFTPRLAMELALLLLLFSSLVTSVMAVRYYTHASFIASIPTGSEARARWAAMGRVYVRRAGVLYSWSLRNLLLIVPPAAYILHPFAGPAVAVVATLVLYWFDRSAAPRSGD